MMQMQIQDYWSKSREDQEYVQMCTEAQAGHGKSGVWRVRGIIITDGLDYCGCVHCEGHRGKREHLNVDEIVCCGHKHAADNAGNRVCSNEGAWDSEWSWGNGPFISQVETFGNTEADIERYRRIIQ